VAVNKIDVGKDAKLKGSVHPKNVPVPEDKATPKAGQKRNRRKIFGYRYEYGILYSKRKGVKWYPVRRWFEKASHRDQAFDKEEKSQISTSIFRYRNLHKTERMA